MPGLHPTPSLSLKSSVASAGSANVCNILEAQESDQDHLTNTGLRPTRLSMNFLRFFAPVITAIVLFTSLQAHALEAESFTKERFDALQAEGAPILVDIYATWCPTCAKQREVLETYQNENPDSELVILEVDFDDQKEWVKHFKAPRQSTLLLFDGSEQVWFSVAETREDKIFAAIGELLGQ